MEREGGGERGEGGGGRETDREGERGMGRETDREGETVGVRGSKIERWGGRRASKRGREREMVQRQRPGREMQQTQRRKTERKKEFILRIN